MAEMGDTHRWGQHMHGGWWQGTDRLKNRRLEKLPLRSRAGNPFWALAELLSSDYIAAQIWEKI